MKKVLVTGIGGNVGQGILLNIKNCISNVSLFGTDINENPAGIFYCNNFFKISEAVSKEFADQVLTIVKSEKVDLIIPSTDDENYILSRMQDEGKIKNVLTSPSNINLIFLDKWINYLEFQKWNIPFANSVLPSSYKKNFNSFIVKPRRGRGSRNIYYNPKDLSAFDDSYVVQELLEGIELTCSFYVDKSGRRVGFIVFERELNNGMTSQCQVSVKYNSELAEIIDEITNRFNIRGPCNIQAKATEKGIKIFEINSRYSGTNSIRSSFGFPDVVWGVEEYLFNKSPRFDQITQGSALRIYCDIIYPNISLNQIKAGNKKAFIKQ